MHLTNLIITTLHVKTSVGAKRHSRAPNWANARAHTPPPFAPETSLCLQECQPTLNSKEAVGQIVGSQTQILKSGEVPSTPITSSPSRSSCELEITRQHPPSSPTPSHLPPQLPIPPHPPRLCSPLSPPRPNPRVSHVNDPW